MDIYPIRLGISFGLIWSICIFILSTFNDFDYSKVIFNIISKMYPKCNLNNISSCLLFGFLDGFIWGVLIGSFYKYLPINY